MRSTSWSPEYFKSQRRLKQATVRSVNGKQAVSGSERKFTKQLEKKLHFTIDSSFHASKAEMLWKNIFNKFTLKVDQHSVLNKPNYDVSAVK